MEMEQLYQKYHSDYKDGFAAGSVEAAAFAFLLRQQDAEDLASKLWAELFTGELIPPADTDLGAWLLTEASIRARQARNRRMKAERRYLRYTEDAPANGERFVVTQSQVEEIATAQDRVPADSDEEYSSALRQCVLSNLPPADQEFLKLYEVKRAKELTPRYGTSEWAVRQRASRLRRRIKKDLASLSK